MSEISIKCPTCGKILKVQGGNNINNLSFTCPVCQEKHKVGDCKRVVKQQRIASEETDYGEAPSPAGRNVKEAGYGSVSSSSNGGEETNAICIGYLVDEFGNRYQLRLGLNTIGRKAMSSTASVQVVDYEGFMSRNHASIEVRNSNGRMLYILKDTENTNPSYVNGSMVTKGDRMILNDGDKLKFGLKILTFKTK